MCSTGDFLWSGPDQSRLDGKSRAVILAFLEPGRVGEARREFDRSEGVIMAVDDARLAPALGGSRDKMISGDWSACRPRHSSARACSQARAGWRGRRDPLRPVRGREPAHALLRFVSFGFRPGATCPSGALWSYTDNRIAVERCRTARSGATSMHGGGVQEGG